ncbi:MAG: CvpA family protein [Clostridiales bacterium]|nr:CvpA family protein [Clostridiales bacterium]
MTSALLAGASWVIDIVFFLILIGGLALGVQRGLIKGICSLAGTFFSIAFAFFFCVSFEVFLDNVFGMTTAISNGLVNSFSKSDAMATPIGADLAQALEAANVPSFVASAIMSTFEGMGVPEGTTPAMLVAPLVAKWIAVAISFVLLIIIMKGGTWIVGKLLTAFIGKIPVLRTVNMVLGGLLGLFEALILLFIVFMILSWIPSETMHSFIAESGVVGKIFVSDWFANATSYISSFQWYEDFLANKLA